MGGRQTLHPKRRNLWRHRPAQDVHVEALVCSSARHDLVKTVQHPPLLLGKEVVRSGHVVVLVQLKASNSVVTGKAEGVEVSQHILFQAVHVPLH
jgi:hypothetical protein